MYRMQRLLFHRFRSNKYKFIFELLPPLNQKFDKSIMTKRSLFSRWIITNYQQQCEIPTKNTKFELAK